MALLKALAAFKPKGGQPGVLIEASPTASGSEGLLGVDTFRSGLPPSISSQDVWPLFLVFAAGVFFADVFVRRVTVSLEWVGPALTWLRVKVFGQAPVVQHEERLDRLRTRKAAIPGEIDERRAATRFEPTMPEQGGSTVTLDQVLQDVAGGAAPTERPKQPTSQLSPENAEQESYTSRLLKAKQQAWKENKDKK